MATRDLPASGTIKFSEVKAEFGKGNNLLDYLGEGGVTPHAPLKLTDFYGKSAGPPPPDMVNPIHQYAGRVLYEGANGTTASTGPAQPWNISDGDMVIYGANYCYGQNSDPSSISIVGGAYFAHVKNARESFGKSPIRYALGHGIDQNISSPQFKMVGRGYDPYWPEDFLGYAYVLPADRLPWADGSPTRVVTNKWSNNIAISDGAPYGYLVLGVMAVHDEGTQPSLGGMQATQGGLSIRKFGGVTLGYKIYQFGSSGNLSVTISGSGFISYHGRYQSTTRNAPVLDLTDYSKFESVSSDEPIMAPPLEDE